MHGWAVPPAFSIPLQGKSKSSCTLSGIVVLCCYWTFGLEKASVIAYLATGLSILLNTYGRIIVIVIFCIRLDS